MAGIPSSLTPYTESNVLLHVIGGELDMARQTLSAMSPRERHELRRALRKVNDLIHEVADAEAAQRTD